MHTGTRLALNASAICVQALLEAKAKELKEIGLNVASTAYECILEGRSSQVCHTPHSTCTVPNPPTTTTATTTPHSLHLSPSPPISPYLSSPLPISPHLFPLPPYRPPPAGTAQYRP